jgi:glycosyltransferase involved in cell wall biosynthesis
MDVRFFGGYDSSYPRNAVLRRGLALNGVGVSECRVRPGYKFWLRYPHLFTGWLLRVPRTTTRASSFTESLTPRTQGPPSFVLVPEFCQKDVPPAKLLSLLTARPLIFDPLASRFETKIVDWRWRPQGSLAGWWNRTIDRWAFRLSDLVIADTRAHRDYYCRLFGLDFRRVEVVPVGFDDRIFSGSLAGHGAERRERKSPFTALFFGSFLPLHGAETVVEAARLAWEADRSIRFLLIGSGQTLPRIRKCAAEYGLENIRFVGWMDQMELARKIAVEADLCLGIFGRTEKAGRVVPHKIFQSIALGKPVVTARTPAVEEFFSHGENIFLCRRDDPRSLAEAVLRLKSDSGLREGIARRGYELAWKKFHPAAIGAILKSALEDRFGRHPVRREQNFKEREKIRLDSHTSRETRGDGRA